MADLVTTIKVDSKQFDNSIKSSTNQVRQFERDNHKAGKSVEQFGGKISGIASGALMGMVGTLGLAKGASDIFMGAMRSTQTTSDAFDVTIAQAKTSVEYFFQALNTGNWSNFFNGITEAVAKARGLQEQLDALSDMKNADQFLQPRDQFEFKKNRTIINDLKSSEEDKALAVENNQKIIDSITERGDAKFKKAKETQSLAFSNALKAFTEEDYKELFNREVILNIVASKLGEKNSSGEMEVDLDKEMPYGFKEIDKKDIKNEMTLIDTEKNKALVLDREQFVLDYINREILSGTNQLYIDFEEKLNALNERVNNGVGAWVQKDGFGGTEYIEQTDDSKYAEWARNKLIEDNAEYAMAYKVKDKFMDNKMKEAIALEQEAYSTLSYAFDLQNQNYRFEKRVDGTKPIKPEEILPEGSLADIDKRIKELNQQISLSINDGERRELNKEIEELKKQKIMIEVIYSLPDIEKQSKYATVSNPFEKGLDALNSKKGIVMPNIEKPLSGMQAWNETMNKVREDNWATIEGFNGISMAMSAIGDAAEGSAAEMLKWAASTLGAIGQAVPAIMALIGVKEAEANANAKAAATGAAASVAGIPFVGGLLAVGAVASVLAAFASIPKFAEGGLVYGNTIAQVGEYAGASNNPEVIAPLSKLRKILSDTNEGNGIGGSVEFKIAGKDLAGTLNNYLSKQRKK